MSDTVRMIEGVARDIRGGSSQPGPVADLLEHIATSLRTEINTLTTERDTLTSKASALAITNGVVTGQLEAAQKTVAQLTAQVKELEIKAALQAEDHKVLRGHFETMASVNESLRAAVTALRGETEKPAAEPPKLDRSKMTATEECMAARDGKL